MPERADRTDNHSGCSEGELRRLLAELAVAHEENERLTSPPSPSSAAFGPLRTNVGSGLPPHLVDATASDAVIC
jgi:hypothetical protein